MAKLEYRPEIDGLRALAVLAVVTYHADPRWMPGGFLGVDAFFVISGFLITSIILRELQDGTFSFAGFWRRRVRRIVPALTLVTACTLIAYWAIAAPPVQQDVGAQALSALGSFANIYFWLTRADYWGLPESASPLLHTWSLSVEEQFYLLYPFMVWIAFRRRASALTWVLASGAAASLALLLVSMDRHPRAAFYLLPTRAWELGAGCLLAVVTRDHRRSRRLAGALALAGLGMVVWACAQAIRHEVARAVAVIGTLFVIEFGRFGVVERVLAHPVAAHIGRVSYSLYLWHWPIFAVARQLGWETTQPTHALACIALSYLLSLGSYTLIEMPMRRHGRVSVILGAAAIVACASATLMWMPRTCDTTGYAKPHTFARHYDLRPRQLELPTTQAILAEMDAPARTAPPDAFRTGGIIVGDATSSPRVVVLGNSHGTMWSDAIRSVVEGIGLTTAFISMNGEPAFMSLPLDPSRAGNRLDAAERMAYDRSRLELIERWKPDLVIICCRWSIVEEPQTRDLMAFLERHATRVLLMEQVPEIRGVVDANVLMHLACMGVRPQDGVRRYLPAGNVRDVERGRALVRMLSSTYSRCGIIPVHEFYLRGREVLALDGTEVVYMDDDHLTTHGARIAIPIIERAIREAVMEGTQSHGEGDRK